MKKTIVIIVLCFCTQYLVAQAMPQVELSQKKLDKYLGKDEPKEFIAGHWPLKILKNLNPVDTALFGHRVAQGNVYKLPVDNMPCLRPDTVTYDDMAEMLPLDIRMPNALLNLSRKNLIWEKKP